jgi:tripartite-type tricarboxylate transporter receptor subunit TctC
MTQSFDARRDDTPRALTRVLLTLAFAAGAGGAMAQPYPAKPIRVISEYVPGSGGDSFARPVVAHLAAATDQQWIIDNRPGAGGLLAVEAAMRTTADGYTVLTASQNALVTRRYLSRAKPIEPASDLTPISALWRTTLVISAHPSFPAKSLKDLIAYARSHPKMVAFTTSGVGTQAHFTGASLALLTGISLLHVPYANNRQVVEVVAGDAPVSINIVAPVLPHVETGRLRPLAVAAHKRLEILPDVPTVSETVPKFEPVPTWTGLFGPAGLPGDIVARLNAAVAKAVANPELRARARASGFELIGNTSEQFVAQLRRDIDVTGRLVKASNIAPTD